MNDSSLDLPLLRNNDKTVEQRQRQQDTAVDLDEQVQSSRISKLCLLLPPILLWIQFDSSLRTDITFHVDRIYVHISVALFAVTNCMYHKMMDEGSYWQIFHLLPDTAVLLVSALVLFLDSTLAFMVLTYVTFWMALAVAVHCAYSLFMGSDDDEETNDGEGVLEV